MIMGVGLGAGNPSYSTRHQTFSLKSKGLLLLVDAHLGKRYGALSAFTAGTHRGTVNLTSPGQNEAS